MRANAPYIDYHAQQAHNTLAARETSTAARINLN